MRWYENWLMWEQGKLEEAPSPDFEEGGNPLALLEAMALAEDQDVSDEAPRLDNAGAEALVASGEITKPESASYQRFWDEDGRPLRSGPPTHQDYYGNDAPASQEELSATRDKPYFLNGDDSVQKWITTPSESEKKPVAGSCVACHVIKRHLDGSICATTHEGEPLQLKLFCDEDRNGVPGADRYVQGLHEGLSSMRVGETAHFVVAPEKAYGLKGLYPTVPGATKRHPRGSWLWYEVELLAIEEDASTGTITDPRSFFLLQRPDGYDWTGLTQQEDQACGFCGRPERALHQRKFKKCSRCKTMVYCSADCAKRHWPTHRLTCSKPEDHLVLEAEASLTNALTVKRDDAVATYISTKLGHVPPKILVIVAYRNQLPLQDRQPQLFKFVPYMIAFLGSCRRDRILRLS